MSQTPTNRHSRIVRGVELAWLAALLSGLGPAAVAADSRLVDAVKQRVADFERGIGGSDRTKMAEYLDAVRDIERRIQAAEAQHANLPTVDQPAGVPATYGEHVRLMFDLQLLAYRSDMTRVGTFILGRT